MALSLNYLIYIELGSNTKILKKFLLTGYFQIDRG